MIKTKIKKYDIVRNKILKIVKRKEIKNEFFGVGNCKFFNVLLWMDYLYWLYGLENGRTCSQKISTVERRDESKEK